MEKYIVGVLEQCLQMHLFLFFSQHLLSHEITKSNTVQIIAYHGTG